MFQGIKHRNVGLARAAINALVFLFPVMAMIVNRSDSIILGLLLLFGIFTWIRSSFGKSLNKYELWLIAAVMAMFAVAVLSYCVGDQTDLGFRVLGR
ncbi:MAG: hypothetical protein ACREBW_04335, partial [Candidatus Micrarchaeaceae archaeon]